MRLTIFPTLTGAMLNCIDPSGFIHSTTEVSYGKRYARRIEEWIKAMDGLSAFDQKVEILDYRQPKETARKLREVH